MALYIELSLTAQTAYAQALDAVLAIEHARTVADLPGSFASKVIRGHRYWYYQYTEPSGKLVQVFVGPEGEPVGRLIAKAQEPGATAALLPLARSAIALGCTDILARHYRVIRRLADYGIFRAGGVLVGTHAFLAYGNMLGVRWGESLRTQDLDFAHAGKKLELALAPDIHIDVPKAIDSLAMGLLPVSSLHSKDGAGATYLNPKEPDFRLDFLTTLHRGGDTPFEHPQLRVKLQPLRFMEFSLEQVQQAALLSSEGAVLANVPHPIRYALHKLLVYGERSGTFQAKAQKDLKQAAMLLALLRERTPEDVVDVWRRDLLKRGKGWASRAIVGWRALNRAFPQLSIADWLPLPSVPKPNTDRRDERPRKPASKTKSPGYQKKRS